MKYLSLIRHAKSSWKNPDLPDIERPLNKRGQRDAPRMAAYCSALYQPDIFLSSPARRALATANEFASRCTGAEVRVEIDEDIYLASNEDLRAVLARVPDTFQHVAMFGHNPGFTCFCNELTGSDIENIPTAGIAVIALDIDSWAEFSVGLKQELKGELENFFYPKMSL